MRDVKGEVFGSRKSVLAEKFIENNINYIQNLWFITCRYAINQNKNTRYLVFIENEQDINLNIFNDYIPIYRLQSAVNGFLAENLRTHSKKVFLFEGFKNWIIEKTNCKYVDSSASGSPNATILSRFFRETMGSGFSLSDVDFYITEKSIFLEEKNYIQKDFGFLGEGQYYTFKEIKNDICPMIDFHIILNNGEDFYLINLNSIDSDRINEQTEWGRMIEFNLGQVYTLDEIIEKYKP